MASVELPSDPGPVSIVWESTLAPEVLRGPLGGAAQRVNRLGNRWRATITLPPLTTAQARKWASALVKGHRLGVLWRIVQVDLDSGTPGTVSVAGAGQAGFELDVDGATASYAYRYGQWLNVITGSRHYLYQLSDGGVFATDGTATLPIEPALRVAPADNDLLELARPCIEGLLVTPPGWSLDLDRLARGFQIVIEEAR